MEQQYYRRIIEDLRKIGIDEEKFKFKLQLKSYSKTYYGRYSPKTKTITLYLYQDPTGIVPVDYRSLFLTAIHEATHCIQWSDKSFVRKKGIMHNQEFYRLFRFYKEKAEEMIDFKEELQ